MGPLPFWAGSTVRACLYGRPPRGINAGKDDARCLRTTKSDQQRDQTQEEYRSLSAAIAAMTVPAAHVAKPVVTAWANQRFGQGDKDTPAPEPQQPQPEQKSD